MTNFCRKGFLAWPFVMTSKKKKKKKREIYFLMFVNMDFFFQNYIEAELKIFFITSDGFFEWQK